MEDLSRCDHINQLLQKPFKLLWSQLVQCSLDSFCSLQMQTEIEVSGINIFGKRPTRDLKESCTMLTDSMRSLLQADKAKYNQQVAVETCDCLQPLVVGRCLVNSEQGVLGFAAALAKHRFTETYRFVQSRTGALTYKCCAASFPYTASKSMSETTGSVPFPGQRQCQLCWEPMLDGQHLLHAVFEEQGHPAVRQPHLLRQLQTHTCGQMNLMLDT